MKAGDRVGPYRVERPLGEGGMGVVFLATDDRLHRQVALKRLSRDRLHDPERRVRFRLEAQAVARLSHASVVQLYDILETDEGDTLVMEYVPGQTLAERIRDHPLDVSTALDLAAQVADGLAAAHAAGLIHRDLKSENVLVTADGRAKILDFGLALAWQSDSGTRLTGDGLAVGTCRAMSPEQARGEDLDPRSDLFALGVLLHELLTGKSPFAAATAAETLLRVCTYEPPPLDCHAAVPPDAARLTRSLLQKEPARRPTSAADVAAMLRRARVGEPTPSPASGEITEASRPMPVAPARRRPGRAFAVAALVAVVPLVAVVAPRFASRPPDVAVAVTRVASEVDPSTPVLGQDLGLRAALLDALVDLEGVRVLAPEEVDPVNGPPRAIARATAADELLTSRLACGPGQCRVTLARVRGSDGGIAWTRTFVTDPAQPLLLRQATASHIREAFAGRRARTRPALDVPPDVYAEFVALRHAFDRAGWSAEVLDDHLRRLRALRQRAPRFVELLVIEGQTLHARFLEQRDSADLEGALARLEEARALAPDDARVLQVQARIDLAGQRLDAAAAALDRLQKVAPGDAEWLLLRGLLADKRGQAPQAIAHLEEAARRHRSWRNLFHLAALEARHGFDAKARAHLDEVLAVFPDSVAARSLLAELELLSGDPARAMALYTRLTEQQSGIAELSNLGLAQLLLRRFEDAEAAFVRVSRLAPRNASVALNLADATALARGESAAAPLYRRALALAKNDPAAQDGETPEWQLASVRAQSLAHLGRKSEAVAEVQSLLRVAADAPQVSFEVALVYALVGERTSAVVSAARAIEGGVQRRWFELPAFDGLRDLPEFAALMRPPPAGGGASRGAAISTAGSD